MQGQTSDLVAKLLVGLVVIAILGYLVVPIFRRIWAVRAENEAFLRAPLVVQELVPGALAIARFRPSPGMAHGVWLDLSLRGPREPRFELFLVVRVAGATLLEGTYPVHFDEEDDARGLPGAAGGLALNTASRSMPRSLSIRSVLRAFRFDAPGAPSDSEVHARIVAGEGVVIEKARLLVTVKDSPR